MSTSTPSRFHNGNGNGNGGSTFSSRPAAATSLSSILAQANSLNSVERNGELPQIRFGIDEIERMSESVGARGKRRTDRGEGQSLLSNLGINTSQLSHTISQLPSGEPSSRPRRKRQNGTRLTAPSSEGGIPYGMNEGDLGAWGRNWHEMVILSGIEEQRQRTVTEFNQQFQQRLLNNWELEKARILQEELGVTDDELSKLTASTSGGSLGASTLGRSSLGASTRRFPMAQSQIGKSSDNQGGMAMHTKMLRYAQVIEQLNNRRLRREPFELCQALEGTVKGDSKWPALPTAYLVLAHLTHEPSVRDASSHASSSAEAFSGAEAVQERQYASAYLGDVRSSHSTALRGRLIVGGRTFLEQDFENHIDETISKNPKDAALGGIPGIKNKIRAFVNVVLRLKDAQEQYKPETVDGVYLWAQVYYLIRAGYFDDAYDLLADHQQSISRDDWSFPGCFKSYLQSPERRLPKAQKDQLWNDYNANVRHSSSVDQFKYALYKIVGRFEISRKNVKVAGTTEDWMWLQLSLVRENKEADSIQDQYDLSDLDKLVTKYGSDKFDVNGTKPFAWFNLLLLTGQFEKAVAYLHSKPQLRTDAVHFAIALAYYGLLRVPARSDDVDLLSYEELPDREVYSLNFNRLIKSYILPFFTAEPNSALQYAYLVALGSEAPNGVGERQKQLALELVRDIVLASRSWSKLLGSVKGDGTKVTGLIERDLKLLKLNSDQDFLQAVVLSAAEQSSLDASLPDSIELYHLAGAYDKVIESVNRALGHSLAQLASEPFRADPNIGLSGAFGGAEDVYGLAQRVHAVYERDLAKRKKVDKRAWETLGVLLILKRALGEFNQDRPDVALETIKSTNLLPLDNDPSTIPQRAEAFKALLDQPTIQNLDIVILTTMKSLYILSQQLKASPYGDKGRMQVLDTYRSQAQSLIRFAGVLRLRLGADVYRQLSSMSASF